MWETWVQSLGQEDPLQKEMVTHSSIVAWRIPWTEEPAWWATVHGNAESDMTERLPKWHSGKESACQWRRQRRCGFNPWVGKVPWRKEMTAHSSILALKIPSTEGTWQVTVHGVTKEADMTERLSTHM